MTALIVHSGLWIAAVAVALLHAASAALDLRPGGVLTAVVALGTIAVYAFDHLVDDQVDKPGRAGFVRKRRRWIAAWSFGCAAGAMGLGLRLPREVIVVLAGVVLLAGVHARLRKIPWLKPVYIAVAWLGVIVGIPAVLAQAGWIRIVAELGPIGLAIIANVLACDAIDDEAEARWLGQASTWKLARLIALLAGIATLFGPLSARPLAAIPLALALALVPFRPREAYANWALDGSILAGAILAWTWIRMG